MTHGMVKPSWTRKKINEKLRSFIAEARELGWRRHSERRRCLYRFSVTYEE